MEAQKKQVNDIRIGFNSRINGIVNYCQKLLKENNIRELNFSAVGGSIGTLVTAVEVFKTLQPGLYQVNRFATISYQSVEEGKKSEVENQRLYPKLEVVLSTEEPKNKTEGFQGKLEEEKRKEIEKIMNERKEQIEKNKGRGGRGRGRGRGGRGRRGGFRGRRAGFRGRPRRGDSRPRRGDSRPRGRGTSRGAPTRARGRGAPRGNRGRGSSNNQNSK